MFANDYFDGSRKHNAQIGKVTKSNWRSSQNSGFGMLKYKQK